MSTTTPAATLPGSQIKKVALASLIGTTIEWYDFYIYGTAAALVFPTQFFPGFSPAAGVLASLATFAVGFASRPLGGFFFGHFGDRIGRKKMLVVTLLTMGIGTFLVGLMPNYSQAGVFAPLGLVILRFVQGFAVGGEWGGAVTMAVEHAPAAQRGFYGSWPQVGSPLGLVFATAIFDLLALLPHAALQSWGWRIPFLLSAVLIVAGLVIRLRLFESPAFARVKAQQQEVKLPAAQVLRRHPGSILIAIGSFLAIEVVFYLVTVLTLSWGTKHAGIPRGTFLTGVLIAGCCMCVMMPVFGALSDRLGRRAVYAGGAVFVALAAFPLYAALLSGSTALIWLGIVVTLAIGHTSMYGPQASLYSEMFPAAIRYSGASIGYQIGGLVGGGLVPLAAVPLLANSGYSAWTLATILAGSAVITFFSVLAAPAINKRYIDPDTPTEAAAAEPDATVRTPAWLRHGAKSSQP